MGVLRFVSSLMFIGASANFKNHTFREQSAARRKIILHFERMYFSDHEL